DYDLAFSIIDSSYILKPLKMVHYYCEGMTHSLFLPTIVIRHRKENLKKCSLRGLEKRGDFRFFSYPLRETPCCRNYLMLTVGAPAELTLADQNFGLLILDATWRYAGQMEKQLELTKTVPTRRLPNHFQTAYPRYQNGCTEPSRGLASIEAIYCA